MGAVDLPALRIIAKINVSSLRPLVDCGTLIVMKKALVVVGWFFSTLLALVVGLTTVSFLRRPQKVDLSALASPIRNDRILAPGAIVPAVKGISTGIETDDARPLLIAEFLQKNSSPLQPYDEWGVFLTQLADKYNLDYRLLPAIATQESNLCKKIPDNTYNCLGLGIHSRGTWGFPSFQANFEKAAEVLRKNYVSQGLITPDQIQSKYTPKSNGSWEFAVNHFMDSLETADF